MWASPAYLNHPFVEVKDLKGQKITIENNEGKLVMLIPETYKDVINEVKTYYSQSRNFYDFEVAQEFSKTK